MSDNSRKLGDELDLDSTNPPADGLAHSGTSPVTTAILPSLYRRACSCTVVDAPLIRRTGTA
jgi:hypothetical protein